MRRLRGNIGKKIKTKKKPGCTIPSLDI